MKISSQVYDYAANQVSNTQAAQAEKAGKHSPIFDGQGNQPVEQKFDFSSMTLKDLSSASKALYDDGVLSLGQHASLSLNYDAIKTGLNQASGEVSMADLKTAENTPIDVIAMQKSRLKEAMQNGAPASQIAFSKTLINTLESYQYGGGGQFHAHA